MSKAYEELDNIINTLSKGNGVSYLTVKNLTDLFSSPYGTNKQLQTSFLPTVISEKISAGLKVNENSLTYRFLLPLANKEEIKLSVEDSKKLTVKATYVDVATDKTVKYEETFVFPSKYPVDANADIQANYEGGVLTVDIPVVPKSVVDVYIN